MPKRKTTRNAQGAGTIRQRPDGRWEARYTIGRDPGSGRQIQKSIYGASQREVLDKLTAVKASLNNGTFTEPSKLSVAQWLDIWLEDYLGGVKPSTVKSYTEHIKNHIKPGLGGVLLQKLSAHMIQNFYNRLQKEKGLSPKTIKNIHGVLHAALKQALTLGYIRNNPSEACILPRIEKPQKTVLADEKLLAFLQAIQGDKYEALLFTALFTGAREGELLGLQWDSINFKTGEILIKHQLQKNRITGVYELVSNKNDRARRIKPARSVIERLQKHRLTQMEQRLLAGGVWDNPFNLVFTNEIGEHLTAKIAWGHCKRIATQIGMPDLRFHDLRHSYAVNALQNGDDPKTVQEALGHHTAAFTLDTYASVSETMLNNSSARMEQFIKSLSNLQRVK